MSLRCFLSFQNHPHILPKPTKIYHNSQFGGRSRAQKSPSKGIRVRGQANEGESTAPWRSPCMLAQSRFEPDSLSTRKQLIETFYRHHKPAHGARDAVICSLHHHGWLLKYLATQGLDVFACVFCVVDRIFCEPFVPSCTWQGFLFIEFQNKACYSANTSIHLAV